MNRLWTALLLLATVVVAGGVVYVIGHNPKIPEAGQTPGASAPAVSASVSSPAASSSPGTSASTSPSPTAASTSGSTSSSSSVSSSSAAKKVLVAFVGDDYTDGLGSSGSSHTFPALVASSLGVTAKRFYYDGAGYAKADANGKTYADLVDSVVAAHPDVVVVTGGRNDRADNVATLTTDAAALFASLHAGLPDAELIAVAPWWGDSTHPDSLSAVDSAVQAGVTASNGVYVSGPDPLYGHPDWMSDDADPNDAGYKAIATALAAKLKPLLPS